LKISYDDEPGENGIAVYENDEMIDIIKTCQDNNLQMCIHSIGDAALEQTLNAYEKAALDNNMKDLRHRIVHCQIGNYDQYHKISYMGININIQPMHTRTDYPLIENRLGNERASKCHAWNTIQEYGVLITGSSDVPCTNCDNAANVFAGISEIVNRDYWLKDEEVSVYDALKMYTINAAYSAFEEDVKGTIENGKFADFVVISEDPISIEKKKIKDIEVEMTILGGKVVYKK
jgi:predicted amidohydrolase YtcJ